MREAHDADRLPVDGIRHGRRVLEQRIDIELPTALD